MKINKPIWAVCALALLSPLPGCGGESSAPASTPSSDSSVPSPASSEASSTPLPTTLSGETVYRGFVENSNLVYARFPLNAEGALGNELTGFGVNWTEDNWQFQSSLTDGNASFARMVVNAPFAGSYPMKVHASNFNQKYDFRVYVNAYEGSSYTDVSVSDPSYSWGSEERVSPNFSLNLNKGKNVLFFQVIRWGAARGVTMPKELDIIKPNRRSSGGSYDQNDFIWQANHLESDVNMLDPDAAMVYRGEKGDADPSYEHGAILNFTPASSTKSLDISYKVKELNAGTAALRIRVGNKASNLYAGDVSSAALNTQASLHIPSYILDGFGFEGGKQAHIQIASASGVIQILGVSESTSADVNQSKTLSISEIKANALIRGRNIPSSNHIGIDFTGAGIEFNLTGGGDVYANLEEVNDHFGSKGSASGGTRFAVEIDGAFKNYVVPSSNVALATGLSESTHRIAIYKTSEAAGGIVNLNSLSIKSSASISKPTKQYKFEILGDSITCGNQISASEENGYLSYATQLSNSYNADANIISCSGRGLKVGYNSETGWNASWDQQINTMWTETSYFRDGGTSKWNTADYVPDVVIANLGNNDLGDWIMQNAPMTISQFTAEVVSFSQRLRTAYPNAYIIWAYGAFVNRSYESQYRAAVASLNDPNIEFVYFNQMGGGADGHPNQAQHQTIADILSAKIATHLGVADPRTK